MRVAVSRNAEVRYENIRSHAGSAAGAESGLRPVARARPCGHPGLRRGPHGAASQRRCTGDGADPGGGATLPADPRPARLRPAGRQQFLAPPADPRARLRLPVRSQPARGGPAAHGSARGGGERVVVDRGSRRPGHRLRGPSADAADHDDHDRGRNEAAGLRDLDGPGAARRPRSGRRSTSGWSGWRSTTSRRRPSPTSASCGSGSTGFAKAGWAAVDQELEEGVRSAAVPIRDGNDGVAAALNVSVHATRMSMQALRRQVVPRAAADGRGDRGRPASRRRCEHGLTGRLRGWRVPVR